MPPFGALNLIEVRILNQEDRVFGLFGLGSRFGCMMLETAFSSSLVALNLRPANFNCANSDILTQFAVADIYHHCMFVLWSGSDSDPIHIHICIVVCL